MKNKLLGAYILVHNEEDLLKNCVEHIMPYVDQLLIVNHGCTDGTQKIIGDIVLDGLKGQCKELNIAFEDYVEPVDMGLLRTKCYNAMKTEWVLNVDADEIYPSESMKKIREFVENPGDAISARVKYYNLSWRKGQFQANFEHYPDRLYKKEVVEEVRGILPDDMHYVKKEYLLAPNKKSGSIGVLEYDNDEDRSFEHPRQPILKDVFFYHLARTRGYNFELEKWTKYNMNMHPDWSREQAMELARKNQWVSGLYISDEMEGLPETRIKNPKVSVIITNYNYGQWVAKAIESAINQTYKAHEVIVVDDCSIDSSVSIIKSFRFPNELKNELPKLKLLQQPDNKGVVQARNWGIHESTGDFFILLDADDYIEPTFIEKCVAKYQETGAEVIFTDMHVFNEIDYNHTYPEFSLEELRKNQCIPSVCAMVERRLFEISGGFREDTVYDDWEFWLRLFIKHKAVSSQVHEFLFNYNRKAGSRVSFLDLKRKEALIELRKEYGVTATE